MLHQYKKYYIILDKYVGIEMTETQPEKFQ
jgi:hypothetical protein